MREVRPTYSPRRDGLYLDIAALDREAAKRAVTMRLIAETAGIPEVTLSRARSGRRIRESTLRKLVDALKKIPIVEGADLLIGWAPVGPTQANDPEPRSVQRRRASKRTRKPQAPAVRPVKNREVPGGCRKTSRRRA